ncbi:MAG: C-GCAxxG-C-C family protein [Negativicutes bacterium]|nr:C-GCAxxG-C-C family protein [Negativicutes bacterium]
MGPVDIADKMFEEGYNCSQSLLYAFSQEFGLNEELALKISRGFGGGMGHMAETCGAVTGAFMVLGLQYEPDDVQARDRLYSQVREFADKFKAIHGSILCKELLRCDMSTPEGAAMFKEKAMRKSHCPDFVRTSAQISEQILREAAPK